MRKFIICLAAVLSLAAAPIAMADEYYETWCGIKVTTVDREAFDDEEEAECFYDAIDIAVCGSTRPSGGN
ncbi:MAG: hypothetical protein HDS06_02945 [Bacteroides sp.]|nr:hypothetical protein [Bacteroides sp.]MBD5313167.1 hypothetical protein [Bacteroides sp.]